MKTVLVSGGSPITVEYWSVTGPAGKGTLAQISLDQANAEMLADFRAKNYNTNDGCTGKRTNTQSKGRAFLFDVDLRSLAGVASASNSLAFLTPQPDLLSEIRPLFRVVWRHHRIVRR